MNKTLSVGTDIDEVRQALGSIHLLGVGSTVGVVPGLCRRAHLSSLFCLCSLDRAMCVKMKMCNSVVHAMPSNSIFPFGDPDVLRLLKKFGGWQRVLDPAYEVPEELYLGFVEAGYAGQRLDKIRAENPRSERDGWIAEISRALYEWWRASFNSMGPEPKAWWSGFPGLTAGVRWQDYPGDWKDQSAEVRERLSIELSDIDDWIANHPDRFKPLNYYPLPGTDHL